MVYCSVPFCTSNSNASKCKGISFHEFPSDIPAREAWISVISRPGSSSEQWYPTDHSRVCSLHFNEDDDYCQGLKIRKLKKGAIPSKFTENPVNKQRVLKQPRPLVAKKASDSKRSRKKSKNDKVTIHPDDGSKEKKTIYQCQSTQTIFKRFINQNTQTMFKRFSDQNTQTILKRFSDQNTQTLFKKFSDQDTQIEELEKKIQLKCKAHKSLTQNSRRLRKRFNTLKIKYKKLQKECETFRKKRANMDLKDIRQGSANGDQRAKFLLEQLKIYRKKKTKWSETTLKYCVLWHSKSPAGYRLVQNCGILSLPSRSTLKRYIRDVLELSGPQNLPWINASSGNIFSFSITSPTQK